MRPLTLHVSALSDYEYDLYTTSLDDLTDTNTPLATTHFRDDAYYERTFVGAREVRAWLRGRYSGLPVSDIDAILKLFCPNMLPSDTLTGGQFFAALRLVVHAGSGKGVDRTLAFVQASPRPVKAPDVLPPLSPPKRPVQAPPSHPDRQKPPLTSSSPETNPFTRRSMDHGALPVLPPDPELSSLFPPPRPSKMSHNPFLARDNATDKTAPAVHSKLPPLPPRKPTLLAAPFRRPSEAVPTPITSTTIMTPFGPPVKPTHVMSSLMKQSLEASKHAQSMKRAEEQLDRERVLQVLKTTSSSSSSASNTTPSTRTRSLSPSKQPHTFSNGHVPGSGSDDTTYVPPLPRRRKPSLPSSTSSSALSLEQVASAALPMPIAAPSRPRLPSRGVATIGGGASTNRAGLPAVAGPGPVPPPTHPHRRPSTSTEPNVDELEPSAPASPRVARSRSVTSSSSAPPPPPRRRRPESMQLTPTADGGGDLAALPRIVSAHGRAHGRAASTQGLSRHLSLTHEPPDASPMGNIQKALTHLQLRAQPKLDAVRYKAEAGISKRGYVHHAHLGLGWREEGEQGLMTDTRWVATDVDREPDSEPTTDDEPSSGEDQGAGRTKPATSAAPYRDFVTESDNLKWSMGEGWNPL